MAPTYMQANVCSVPFSAYEVWYLKVSYRES